MPLPAKALRIGRSQDNGVVVADLKCHAVTRSCAGPGGEYEIADLGSHNGTFLNGQRITRATVTGADAIGIGPATFRLVGDELQEFVDGGDVSLDARGLTVTLPNGKVLLDDVSFPLGERCLLGVIGPSGAGKSTLLGALTGMRPATAGSVSMTAAIFTTTTPSCGTGSAWCPRRTSCTLSCPHTARWAMRPSSGSRATPARMSGRDGSGRCSASCL